MNESPPLLCKVPEACRRLGNIGRTKLYELGKAGEIEMLKIGGCTMVPLDSIERYVERLRTTAPAVERLVEVIDASGMVDVARIPPGTTLADLEAAKRIIAERGATNAA
jgi:uncharacterized protein (UPF0261 family)